MDHSLNLFLLLLSIYQTLSNSGHGINFFSTEFPTNQVSLSVPLNQASSLSLIPFSISVAFRSYKNGKHAKCESSYCDCMSKIQLCFVDTRPNTVHQIFLFHIC
jgi:hypothetical protein